MSNISKTFDVYSNVAVAVEDATGTTDNILAYPFIRKNELLEAASFNLSSIWLLVWSHTPYYPVKFDIDSNLKKELDVDHDDTNR